MWIDRAQVSAISGEVWFTQNLSSWKYETRRDGWSLGEDAMCVSPHANSRGQRAVELKRVPVKVADNISLLCALELLFRFCSRMFRLGR